MESVNIGFILVVAAAILLVVFLIIRNKKDRKELINPDTMDSPDALEEERREQKSREEQL